MNIAVPNFEDAASLTAEFITSLDNLPNEVHHLLQEIKFKEERCQELQQDIAKDQARYIKASLKTTQIVIPPVATTNSQNKSRTSSPAPTPNGIHPKAHLPGRIAASYAEIDALTEEKIALAHRIIELITRTRARLDSDLAKVRLLQGEPLEGVRNASLATIQPLATATPYSGKRPEHVNVVPIIQIGENLRHSVVSQPEVVPPSAASTGPGYNKKRKLTTTTSVKLSSPGPSSAAPVVSQRSRSSRQIQTSRLQPQDDEDVDKDAEGEDDIDAEDAEEDSTPYCFCQKPSYGDMIGCDNPDCPYQWFHINCVGVKPPLPDKWYCPHCSKQTAGGEKRKGRKK